LRDAASDASSILAASTSRPEPGMLGHDYGRRFVTHGGRMIVDRWTQAILPPGSDENPNVPGI
jgi:hypothetical protein